MRKDNSPLEKFHERRERETTRNIQTVSRRSEPSSRTTLMGEQPNPWDRLQPQDVMSRHRGAEPRRRYELSGETSLLSPRKLLSVKPFPKSHRTRGSLPPPFAPARIVALAVKLAYAYTLTLRFPSGVSQPLYPSVTLLEGPAPGKLTA